MDEQNTEALQRGAAASEHLVVREEQNTICECGVNE